MKRFAAFAALAVALAVPAVASAHATYATQTYSSNIFSDSGTSVAVATLGCGDGVGIDSDSGTSDPAIRYINKPGGVGSSITFDVGYGVGALHYHAPESKLIDVEGYTVNFSGDSPASELGSRDNVLVYPLGVQFDTVKFHAYSGHWFVKRHC